jgi:redox-sensitive bicupin YhaK (pirin superfamily)
MANRVLQLLAEKFTDHGPFMMNTNHEIAQTIHDTKRKDETKSGGPN